MFPVFEKHITYCKTGQTKIHEYIKSHTKTQLASAVQNIRQEGCAAAERAGPQATYLGKLHKNDEFVWNF